MYYFDTKPFIIIKHRHVQFIRNNCKLQEGMAYDCHKPVLEHHKICTKHGIVISIILILSESFTSKTADVPEGQTFAQEAIIG